MHDYSVSQLWSEDVSEDLLLSNFVDEAIKLIHQSCYKLNNDPYSSTQLRYLVWGILILADFYVVQRGRHGYSRQ